MRILWRSRPRRRWCSMVWCTRALHRSKKPSPPIHSIRAARSGAARSRSTRKPASSSGKSTWHRLDMRAWRCGGSSLVPDLLRGVVYVTTGNNYTTPTAPEFKSCVKGRALTDALVTECISDDDVVDSIVALSMKDGRVRWSHRMWSQDDWNVACLVGFASGQGNCPDPQGPDYDFSSGANLFVIKTKHGLREVLGAGREVRCLLCARSRHGQALVGHASGTGLGARWHRVGLGDRR